MDSLEDRVTRIERRNQTVELDKAWELSGTRRVLIVASTYVAIVILLHVLEIERPWTSAVVPTVAFVISTLTLPLFKKVWIEKNLKNG